MSESATPQEVLTLLVTGDDPEIAGIFEAVEAFVKNTRGTVRRLVPGTTPGQTKISILFDGSPDELGSFTEEVEAMMETMGIPVLDAVPSEDEVIEGGRLADKKTLVEPPEDDSPWSRRTMS